MPELPDVTVYVAALRRRLVGRPIEQVRVASPFLVRTFDPPIEAIVGQQVLSVRRLGKQIVWELEADLALVIHLMIAGRFHWKPKGAKLQGKIGLAAFDLPDGTLMLTEASSKKRAAIHLVRGADALAAFDRGGLEVLAASPEQFKSVLLSGNHTLKRALTDPRLLSGIGNAYSDEILHRARLSPVKLTSRLTDQEVERLYSATRACLQEWIDRLLAEVGDRFPEKVTAFHPAMAVHGRYGQPCPACGAPIQRIVYAEHEANYCARCQTDGKLLADRGLSRLLKSDWPRTLEELEQRRAAARPSR